MLTLSSKRALNRISPFRMSKAQVATATDLNALPLSTPAAAAARLCLKCVCLFLLCVEVALLTSQPTGPVDLVFGSESESLIVVVVQPAQCSSESLR